MDLRKVTGEAKLTRYMFDKASQANVPLSGAFELSPICNFACKMCYVRKTAQEVKNSSRPMLTCEQWLEIAGEMKLQDMLYLLLTGGEPLLWPDFWKLYEELGRMGFLISINTNGSLIDEAAVERLKKMCPTRINVTLYGASDETYESLCGVKGMFTKVDKAISMLKEAGIPMRLNCSLTPHNVHDLEKIVRYAEEKDLLLSATTYMFPPIRRDALRIGENERFTPEEAAYYNMKRYRLQYGEEAYWEYVERQAAVLQPPTGLEESCMDSRDGHITCRAGNASFWITWDGYMTPCGMIGEPKVDMHHFSGEDAWRTLSYLCREIALSSVCRDCRNRKICHVCAATAMTETGDFSGIPKYLCENMRAVKELAEKELAQKRTVEKTENIDAKTLRQEGKK